MARIRFDQVTKRYGAGHRRRPARPRDPRSGVRGAARALGLRQDHDPQHDRGARGAVRGRSLFRRSHRQFHAAASSATSPWCSRATRSIRTRRCTRTSPSACACAAAAAATRSTRRVRDAAERLHIRHLLGPQAASALGRAAPARGAGPRHGAPACRVPDGRAALQSRCDACASRCAPRSSSCTRRCRPPSSTSPTTRPRR